MTKADTLNLSYTPIHPVTTSFHRSNSFARWLMGPLGCLSADAPIVTEFGVIPISRIDRPMRVLSWNEKTCRFQLSWCAGSFPRGKDYLYRVSTPQGEFDASGSHQLLCADGKYRQVKDLQVGSILAAGAVAPQQTSSSLSQSESYEDARHSLGTAADYLDGYGALVHQCGQQLLQELSTAQEHVPSQVGVRGCSRVFSLANSMRTGVLLGLSQVRNRCGQFFYHLKTMSFAPLLASAPEALVDFCVLESSEPCVGKPPILQQSQRHLCSRQQVPLLRRLRQWFQQYVPYISPNKGLTAPNRAIIAITRKHVQEVFWDLQVEGTHNYVTTDGAVHHNCGKSYAIMWEILIRAAQQPLSAQGKRRCRVIFVRNTRQMLTDSVLPILREVFVEGRIGYWRASESVYQVRLKDMELDILLRPLEDDSDIRRVLSINATFCVIDEWREIPVSTVIQLAGRAGRFPAKEEEGCAFAGVFGASNPPVEGSDWWEALEVKHPAGWDLFRFPSARSPEATWKKYLRDGYYESLMEGGTEDYIRVMIDGEYGRSLAGRGVYEKSFKHDFHVAKEPLIPIAIHGHPVIIGMDFGRTPAATFLQKDAKGRILVLDSLYQENMGLEKFIREHVKPLLSQKYPNNRVICIGDPAGWAKTQISEESVADVFRREGLFAKRSPTNDPEKRVAAVEKVLLQQTDGKASIIFDPGLAHLIRGMNGGYKYRRKTTGDYEEKPQKDEYSHDQDSLQYGVLGIDSGGASEVFSHNQRRELTKVNYVWN